DGQPRTPGAEPPIRKIDALAALEEWRSLSLLPEHWAAQLSRLRDLVDLTSWPADRHTHELALVLRGQAAVLDLFDESLAEAAEALDSGREIPLEAFWRAVKSVLRLKPLR